MRSIGIRVATLALALVALLPACKLFGGAPGEIKVSAIAGLVTDIADRHDAYVNTDTSLQMSEMQIYLSESMNVRVLISGLDYVHVGQLEPAMDPVMRRYDAYVAGDPALTEQKRAALLRSTQILQAEVFPAARGE